MQPRPIGCPDRLFGNDDQVRIVGVRGKQPFGSFQEIGVVADPLLVPAFDHGADRLAHAAAVIQPVDNIGPHLERSVSPVVVSEASTAVAAADAGSAPIKAIRENGPGG